MQYSKKESNNRNLYIFDLDGTILKPGTSSVSTPIIDAMRYAKEQGHILAINTGRGLEEKEFQVELDGIIDYWGYSDGHVICDSEHNIIHSTYFDINDLTNIIHKAVTSGLSVILVSLRNEPKIDNDNIDLLKDPDFKETLATVSELFIKKRADDAEGVDSINKLEAYLKVGIGNEQFSTPIKYETHTSTSLFNIDPITKEHVALKELRISAGCDKSNTVKYIASKENIDATYIHVFGDGFNDIPAFRCAKNRVLIKSVEVSTQDKLEAEASVILTQQEIPSYIRGGE